MALAGGESDFGGLERLEPWENKGVPGENASSLTRLLRGRAGKPKTRPSADHTVARKTWSVPYYFQMGRVHVFGLGMAFVTLSQLGCVSQIAPLSEYADSWIGRSYDEMVTIQKQSKTYADRSGRKESTYMLPNGNTAYVEPIRPDCFIHWEVNSDRLIVAYRKVGKNCWE